jgi:serine/threonine protein kinase
MGVVYKAYDTEVGREVALKTIGDVTGRAALELFYKEWRVLANLHHPNIVEIFDIGEFQEGNISKPFFVMPLLKGTTLDQLIRAPGQTMMPQERMVEIMSQLCRGLHAAHENGLVHRDLKPSNVFVMDFNSVKLIDFGVAHLLGGASSTGLKGTMWYMAPEQIQNQECTPASDIFALGVLCYESLTGMRPFQGKNLEEVFDAILHRIPPPASELNPQVSQPISRVIHKALAKQPRHRYSSALEFADTLHRALRNEQIDFFDPAIIQPRIQRAMRSFEQGNYQLAGDILADVVAAGHIDPTMTHLRRQIDQAQRKKTVTELLERARNGIAEEEYSLATQNIEQLLKLDPGNEEGLRLKDAIDQNLGQKQIDGWLRAATSAIATHSYDRARQVLQKVLERHPDSPRGLELLAEVEVREHAYRQARQEKDLLYQGARDAWDSCEFETALAKLRRVLELEEQAPDTATPETRSNYMAFFKLVESAHMGVQGAVSEYYKSLQKRDFERAEQICSEYSTRFPGHPLFEGLRLNLAEAKTYYTAELINSYRRKAIEEPDYVKRTAILREAADRFPGEPYFEAWINRLRERASFAKSMIAKARQHEEAGRYDEAHERWRMLRRTDPNFPGVDDEIARFAGLAGTVLPEIDPGRSGWIPPGPPPDLPMGGSYPGGSSTSAGGGSAGAATAFATAATPIRPAPPQVQFSDPHRSPAGTPAAAPPRPADKPAANAGAPRQVKGPGLADRALAGLRTGFASIASQASRFKRNTKTGTATPSKRPAWLIPVALLALVLTIAGVVAARRGSVEPAAPEGLRYQPTASTVPVTIQSATPGATIRINKADVGVADPNLKLNLKPGTYEIEAIMAGRKTWFDSLHVAADKPPSVSIPALGLLPSTYRVSTDFEKGFVWLDGKRLGPLKESQFLLEDLPAGKHTIIVGDTTNYAPVTFEVTSGAAPVVSSVQKSPLSTIVVSATGDDSRVYTNVAAAKYAVDGNAPIDMPAEGAALKGTHDVVITSASKDPVSLRVENSPAPTLMVRVYSDRNVGTLVVNVPGSDPFQVLLDGKEMPVRLSQDGRVRIPMLQAKSYTLVVRRSGYENYEEKVNVKKGQELPVTPVLKALPQVATLRIEGVQPDASVFVDGAQVGKVQPDGTFVSQSIAPGDHEIGLKKPPAFKDRSVTRNFKPRSSLTISGAELAMDKLPATVNVTIAAGAKGFYKCADGGEHEITQTTTTITCREGQGVFRATRSGYDDDTRDVALTAGGTFNVTLAPKQRNEAARTRVSCGTEQLAATGWKAADGEFKGPGTLPCAGRTGVYEFTLMRGKKMHWIIPGAGTFQVDKNKLSGSGIKEDLKKITGSEGAVTIRIDIAANRVTHSVKTAGASWKQLQPIDVANGTVLSGPIRFDNDAVLTAFSFNER